MVDRKLFKVFYDDYLRFEETGDFKPELKL